MAYQGPDGSWYDEYGQQVASGSLDDHTDPTLNDPTAAPPSIAPPIGGGTWAPGTPQANGQTPTFTPTPGTTTTPVTNDAGQVWGAGGQNGNYDTNGKPMSFAPAGGDTGGGDPGGSPAPSPVDVPSNVTIDPAQAAYNASIRQSILDQLHGDLSQPETADSSDIAPAIGAYNTQSQRDEQAARDQIAEQAYASDGGSALHSGGFNTALAANRENMAGKRANFVGQAVMQGGQAKRQQLQQLLQTATQYGDTQTAQQIQSQLGLLNAQLQEQGLQQGFATSNNQLGFNYAALIAQMNRDALLGGLQG